VPIRAVGALRGLRPAKLPAAMPLRQLSETDRMRLMKFVCSFAWADLKVRDEERQFIGRLVRGLRLEASEIVQVEVWLEVPPEVDDLDPMAIPEVHRRLFLEAIEGVISADGEISAEERDSLAVFRALIEG